MLQLRSHRFSPPFLALSFFLALAACHGTHYTATTLPTTVPSGLQEPTPTASVEAIATPPIGWKPDPLKKSPNHTHQVWISPSGNTAYGIIHAHMPLPVGPELALTGFLSAMRKTEGEATLLSKEPDPDDQPQLRFVAEGGKYKIRAKLITHGWITWVVYAGTLRGKPDVPAELKLAERAREATVVGLPEQQ